MSMKLLLLTRWREAIENGRQYKREKNKQIKGILKLIAQGKVLRATDKYTLYEV